MFRSGRDRLEQLLIQQPAIPQSEAKAEVSSEGPAALLSELRYGSWSRSFRFPQTINREHLQASYRDGLLTVTAPQLQPGAFCW